MYSIFINERCLLFTSIGKEHIAQEEVKLCTPSSKIVVKEYIYSNLLELKYDFEQSMSSSDCSYIILCQNPENVFKTFVSFFPNIDAGGGLVETCLDNREPRYLYIFRRGYWDLPKGKQEKGECISDTALREVEEETGVSKLHIVKALPDTYHFMTYKKEWAIKHSYWFHMKTEDPKACNTQPQTEEGITEAKWLKSSEIKDLFRLMYPSILFLSQSFFGSTQK